MSRFTRTVNCVVVLMLLLVGLVGFCFAQVESTNDLTKAYQGSIIGENKDYTLGKGDVVDITVREQPEFTGQFVIGPDGKIQYTFVGDIEAEGKTKDELKEILNSKLRKYIKVPEVSVAILAYRSKYVYILGEVGRPGKYPMQGDSINLRDAVVNAGLPTRAAALRRIYVIEPTEEKRPKFQKIDLYRLLYKGDLRDNVMLNPGDLVVVPSTIPSEINRALTNILSPVSQASDIEDIVNDN